jgi:hypothetical protein
MVLLLSCQRSDSVVVESTLETARRSCGCDPIDAEGQAGVDKGLNTFYVARELVSFELSIASLCSNIIRLEIRSHTLWETDSTRNVSS